MIPNYLNLPLLCWNRCLSCMNGCVYVPWDCVGILIVESCAELCIVLV